MFEPLGVAARRQAAAFTLALMERYFTFDALLRLGRRADTLRQRYAARVDALIYVDTFVTL